MKILLIGNGGRENALAWKISESPSFKKLSGKIYCTKGNPGINNFAESIDISPTEIDLLVDFAVKEKINFCVVGPEVPLSMGIVNRFEKKGILIFGPTKEAAEIESSKVFAKNMMLRSGIPTAKFHAFSLTEAEKVFEFLKGTSYPAVIKADGLAAGKGVVIAESESDAIKVVKDFSMSNTMGEASRNFVIEEFLDGEEVSVFVITDGTGYVILPFSQDHKKILEDDKGKNTGGMGAIAPLKKFMTPDIESKIRIRIVEPVLKALREDGRTFKGCLYCGLMICENDPYVIEFNCRLGDPETQAVLPLIESDFLEMLMSSAKGKIVSEVKFSSDYTCCVVISSGGYPDKYETGKVISGLENGNGSGLIFQSGTKYGKDTPEVLSSGGRVLSIVGISKDSLKEAVKNAYEIVAKIKFENMYFRKDIGKKQLKETKEVIN